MPSQSDIYLKLFIELNWKLFRVINEYFVTHMWHNKNISCRYMYLKQSIDIQAFIWCILYTQKGTLIYAIIVCIFIFFFF